MSEANRYKEILNEIAKSITTDLDKTTVSYDKDMAEHMKQTLKKKRKEL